MRGALLALLLLGQNASAEVFDLAAEVTKACGPEGYRPNIGCQVTLPKGTLDVSSTAIGHCTAPTARVGVTLQGQSFGMPAVSPPFSMAGTTLHYVGEPGKPVLSFCGVSSLVLRDLAIDGAGSASVGVRVSANNAQSGIAHFSDLERLTITGATKGVEVTGEGKNDQTDFVALRQVSIAKVDYGYWQDSQQSVNGELSLVESVARRESYHLGGGSLVCNGCYAASAGDADPSYIGWHATKSEQVDGRNFSHHQMTIRDGHSEVRVGRFVVGDVKGNPYPLLVVGHSFSIQCGTPGCSLRIIDWQGGSPPVIQANVVQASGGNLPTGTFCAPAGWRSTGNVRKPEVKALTWTCP